MNLNQAKRKPRWPKNCFCGNLESLDTKVWCHSCGKWYHKKCINFPDESDFSIEYLCCSNCSQRYGDKTVIRKKCRFQNCTQTGTENSEFCSEEHENEYWLNVEKRLTDKDQVAVLKHILSESRGDYQTFRVIAPGIKPYPAPTLVHPDAYTERQAKLNEIISKRQETRQCLFNNECTNSVACTLHQNWVDVETRKLEKLLAESNNQLENVWKNKIKENHAPGTIVLAKRQEKQVGYLNPYIWHNDAQAYFLNGDMRSFRERYN